jgi:hypothetical protein
MLPRQPAQDVVLNILLSAARTAQDNRMNPFEAVFSFRRRKELADYDTGRPSGERD